MFKFPKQVGNGLTVIAYMLLSIFIVMRLFIKKIDGDAICRSTTMIIMMLASTIDIIWVAFDRHRSTSWIVPIFNVAIILFFVRSIREVWIQFSKVLVKSVPVFIIIIAYFLLFIIIGFIMFGQNDSSDSFRTIN